MQDKVDVLIIGSGASGAAVAWSLAETRMKILCLEQGDWMKQSDYPSNGRDYEARVFSDYATSPNIRKRPSDYPINDDNSPIKVVNFNAVGGSTVMYTAHYPRLHPSDFRVRTLDGVADDWPIDYATLEPFFAENDRMTGVSGLAGDPAYPAHEPPMPPLPLGRSGAKIAQTMNQLGWHWWPSDSAIATTEYDGRAPCINLGHCTPACAQGAKASTDITYWPHAIRAGVELRTNCRVREITTGDDGMATGVVYYDGDGVEQFQPAEVVILACNGVGTPRLLLNSASGRFPNGLANSSGLVGKNLMFHPWAHGARLCRRTDGRASRPAALPVEPGVLRDRPLARLRARLQLPVQPHHRHRHRGGQRRGQRPAALGRGPSRRFPQPGRPPHVGRHLHRGPAGGAQPGHARSGAEGQPRHSGAQGSTTPSARTPAACSTSRSIAARRSSPPPVRGTFTSSAPWSTAAGTCSARPAWADDPERSVVNSWGRSHDVKNLFIVDGSIFVTSGGVNPDLHDPGAGAVHRRQHEATPGNPVRLRPS